MRCSGVDLKSRAKEGVGIIVNQEIKQKLIHWEPMISQIIQFDVQLEESVSLITIYAPPEDKDVIEKEKFYSTLQRTMEKARESNEQVPVMGDWNNRVGNNMRGKGSMGNYGIDTSFHDNGK